MKKNSDIKPKAFEVIEECDQDCSDHEKEDIEQP
jgi:hypothetical protein